MEDYPHKCPTPRANMVKYAYETKRPRVHPLHHNTA